MSNIDKYIIAVIEVIVGSWVLIMALPISVHDSWSIWCGIWGAIATLRGGYYLIFKE